MPKPHKQVFVCTQQRPAGHPRNGRLFVEAVNAWGRDGQIKAEPRLLPMVS